MFSSSHDLKLEESFEKLNSIVARRNELLQEMFRLMQSKKDFASVLRNPEQDDPHLRAFIKRFDLSSNFDQGSVIHLREEEIWFLDDNAKHSDLISPSSDLVLEGISSSPTRTTRSRSGVAGLAKSPSPTSIGSLRDITSEGPFPRKDEEDQAIQSASPAPSNSHLTDARGLLAGTPDEDNDELDLIGPSTFSAGEPNLVREISSTPARSLSPVSKKDNQEDLTPPKTRFRSSSLGFSSNRHTPNEALVEDGARVLADQSAIESVSGGLINSTADNQLPEQSHLLDSEMISSADVKMESPPPIESGTAYTDDSLQRGTVAEGDHHIIPDIPPDLRINNVSDEMVLSVNPSTEARREGVSPSAATVKPVYIQISLPPSIQEEILIPTPMVAGKETSYNLDIDLTTESEKPQPSLTSVDNRHYFNPQYTLPSLDLLPAEFTRKVRPTKRKRERAGERDGKRDKDDVPLGLNRWNAILTANPVWRRVSRASKCLSTREWGVAMSELRLIRAIQRIDQLKEEGRWSFRQPKKQRGVGGLSKTHWDYLLDEMKWMRTDFREERRWKIALAYNLSTAVLEWHLAKTPDERQRTGICIKWQSSHFRASQDNTPQSMNVECTEQEQSHPQLLGILYGSDDEDGQENDIRNVVDVLEPSAMIQDALLESATDLRPKNEEVDDRTAIELLHLGAEETRHSFEDSPVEFAGGIQPGSRLKTTSNDPLLAGTKSSSQSTNGDGETLDSSVVDLKSAKTALVPFREQIAYSEGDQLFVDVSNQTSKDDTYQVSDSSDPSDLHALFPELQPLGLLDIPMATGPTDGKKRIEKRSDRDDPNKRTEDTTYTKLYPIGRFMYAKPTLIGPLQPSKRWKDGKWSPLEQTPITSDTEPNIRISEDNTSELFDGRSNTLNFAFQLHASSFKDKEGKRESSAHAWNAGDDALLRSLVDKYSTNWPLISECFNSSRLSTLTDTRSAADCLHRWKEKWGSERKLPPMESTQTSGDTTSLGNSQMTTRGVKRLASSSISSPTTTSAAGNTETRKRRRHLLLQDSIRKAGKKRVEAVQKALANQRKPPQVHETHNQFNKLPKLSPAELSRMKAERDLRDSQDIALARKRQDEQIRQTLLLREQAQRGNTQGQIQQQQSQGQQSQAAQQPQPQPPAPSHQQQLTQQQLAQLQQLQQQANQNPRQNVSTSVLSNRPTRLSAATNPRQAGQQAQLLQQQRPLQAPMQVQAGVSSNTPSNPLSQVQAPGNTFYGLPPNVTQEQVKSFPAQLLTAQQQQQQGQSTLNNFGVQPP